MKSIRDELAGEDLDVTSDPVALEGAAPDIDASVAVVAMPIDYESKALVLASMRRLRRAVHEELHAQLLVDDAFVDAVRAPEVEFGADLEHVTFVARFELPPVYFDGVKHRARVVFGNAVSRVVLRGQAQATTTGEEAAAAAADFVATPIALATGT